jgi:hypothetical protein
VGRLRTARCQIVVPAELDLIKLPSKGLFRHGFAHNALAPARGCIINPGGGVEHAS